MVVLAVALAEKFADRVVEWWSATGISKADESYAFGAIPRNFGIRSICNYMKN
jgi:hypothetical protein